MGERSGMDAHARPPAAIRDWFKAAQRGQATLAEDDPEKTRSSILLSGDEAIVPQRTSVDFPHRLGASFREFLGISTPKPTPVSVYGIPAIPVQLLLLDKLFHRDLSNPQHKTNVHTHYDVPYPPQQISYFDRSAADLDFIPKDPAIHKAFDTRQYLDRKLRWTTLGGQYDWTKKVYPSTAPPEFPADIERLINGIFAVKAEAAIVNLYSPGDTLSLHRDVSEDCDQALVSISFGCDGIFVIGLDGVDGGESTTATIRLKSGDAVVMGRQSRHAWHGVPKVIEGTCPQWMKDWPCTSTANLERYEHWIGWMAGKRVNLNVRQMFDDPS